MVALLVVPMTAFSCHAVEGHPRYHYCTDAEIGANMDLKGNWEKLQRRTFKHPYVERSSLGCDYGPCTLYMKLQSPT